MKKQFIQIAIATGLFYAPVMALAQDRGLNVGEVKSNVTESAISVGDTLAVEFSGTPGVRASILLIGDKQTIREYKAQEVAPGSYVSKVILGQRDRLTEGVILVRLQQGSQVIYRSLEQAFAVLPSSQANLPSNSQTVNPDVVNTSGLTLAFTSHQHEQVIEASSVITLEGQTEPGAEVQIGVSTSKTLIGGLAVIQGNTQINRVVQANQEGIFKVQIPQEPNAPRGLRYEIMATARTQTSQSRPIQLTLVQK